MFIFIHLLNIIEHLFYYCHILCPEAVAINKTGKTFVLHGSAYSARRVLSIKYSLILTMA